ncbi:unnamed protein product [Gongylonema pulchrum]|uniref:Uncharacterized protein n=1 Tax=Gongylonema pulchrum TaxID=637853 RepID=A0A183EYK3_9BILA|nr:unnamed protein product [Gongylonema pulchrum]
MKRAQLLFCYYMFLEDFFDFVILSFFEQKVAAMIGLMGLASGGQCFSVVELTYLNAADELPIYDWIISALQIVYNANFLPLIPRIP